MLLSFILKQKRLGMDGVLMSDRPVLDPGEIVCSSDGTYAFRIVEHIGEGRCCLVYSAKSIRDSKTKVALKVPLTRSKVLVLTFPSVKVDLPR